MGLSNPVHLAFIAMIALIFLGPKKLPDMARSIGSGMREFRDSLSAEHGPDAELTPPVAEVSAHTPPPAAEDGSHAPAVTPAASPVTPPTVPASPPAAGAPAAPAPPPTA